MRWIKISCETQVSKTQVLVGTYHARRRRDRECTVVYKLWTAPMEIVNCTVDRRRRRDRELHRSLQIVNCTHGDRELHRRSTIGMCLMETGFVCAVGLLLCYGSSFSLWIFFFFLSFCWVSSFLLSFFWVFFSVLCILKSSVKDSRSMWQKLVQINK